MIDLEALVAELEACPPIPFSRWPAAAVPPVAAGVYTVWLGDQLLHAAAAGRGLNGAALLARAMNRERTGLAARLASHASGRRAGDPLCLALCDRFVVPALGPHELRQVGEGALSLDARVRAFVRERLAFRFVVTPDGAAAAALERAVRAGALRAGKPLLHPE